MIYKQYQNRGYGREAMKKILEFIRTFPAGPAHASESESFVK